MLREAIVEGDYEPGERLVETPLCERFGVSRTVIREALRQLESEGLVRMVPNRGPVVAELTVADARALYEVRTALEGLAAALFAERADDDTRASLVDALEAIREAYAGTDIGRRLAAKDRFYDILFAGAGNEVIESVLRGIHARVQLMRRLSLGSPGRLQRSLDELTRITHSAAIDRDPIEARAASEAHVRAATDVALRALAARLDETAGPAPEPRVVSGRSR
jgi:DNA-binding GntR family transcriptional regulator